ncbi:MAG: putative acid phosphatase [Myxococcales bacterium]|nr:putative acid phosphatase [Myxococcales bacterium]
MQKFNAAILLGALAAAGCTNNSGSTSVACQALTAAPAKPAPQWSGSVFTIVMENKGQRDIVGNSQAPFINQLAKQNAVAAGYHDSFVHPSEPNYIWMIAGENFGILDDADPASHHLDSKSHLADQLEMAGLSWKAYQESMGAPCGLESHGTYAAKHNPFVYFDDINGWDGTQFQPSQRCRDHVVDYSQLDADLASDSVPKYAFITPNLVNDMHDGSVAQGDAWLQTEVTKIVGSRAFNDGGVLFLLWDEGAGVVSIGDDPPFLAISPNAKQGYNSTADYDTSSYLKTVQTILDLSPLPCDPDPTAVTSMDELFTVPLAAAK